jgi:hypothetical protein
MLSKLQPQLWSLWHHYIDQAELVYFTNMVLLNNLIWNQFYVFLGKTWQVDAYSACFISETTEWISVKHGYLGYSLRIAGEILFWFVLAQYNSNFIWIQTELHWFPKKGLTVQKVGTLHKI